MLVPLPSNHIVKFWFLELPKTHLEFLMTHQERQRACLQLTTVTAISRKGKLSSQPLLQQFQERKSSTVIFETHKCRLPRTLLPLTPTALAGSQTDESQTAQRCEGEHQSSHIWVWSAEKLQKLLCPASSHCTVIQRFSNLHLPFTCQPLLHGQISLWIAICTISSLHQTSLVPSTGCLFFSSTVSKHDVLDNLLWTRCLKIYTNCDWEHCGLQCTAEWHQ